MKHSLSNPAAPEADALKTAARWQVRHEAGLTPAEQTEFSAWLAASPDHARAWRQVAATARMFAQINRNDTTVADMLLELARRRRRRTWRIVTGTGLGLGLAAAAAFVAVLRGPAPEPTARLEPPVESRADQVIEVTSVPPASASILVRADRHLLEDGSRVEFKTGTKLRIHYTAARREVTLLSGEALFTVVKQPDRPFVVRTGGVEVRAVGTAFAVQLAAESVDVLVTAGTVAVTDSTAATPVLVDANRLMAIPTAPKTVGLPAPREISDEAVGHRLAWTRPRLQLDETPLAEAVSVLNQENLTIIVIGDPQLAQRRLTGSFMADDSIGFVRLLVSAYGVRVERRDRNTVVLRGE